MTYTPPAEQSVTLSLNAEAYVNLGTDIGIDFTNRSAFTIEGWFKFNGLCPDSTLYEKPGQISFKTRGQKVSASFVGQPMPLETDDILNTETDFHVAVTYDGQTLSLYVNGLLRVQSSFSFTPPPANQNPAVIGRDLQAYCHYVRLWSVARQQDEIYANEWTYLTSGTAGASAALAQGDINL
ncbi:MAG: LamG domain-containing protein, partial [Nitratireductor sp.]